MRGQAEMGQRKLKSSPEVHDGTGNSIAGNNSISRAFATFAHLTKGSGRDSIGFGCP